MPFFNALFLLTLFDGNGSLSLWDNPSNSLNSPNDFLLSAIIRKSKSANPVTWPPVAG
jgi:hypothetical protein